MRRLAIIATVLLAGLTATAAKAQDEPACGYADFVDAALSKGAEIARVTAARANFADCPEATTACRRKAYVVARNAVLVSKARNGWTCAWYPGARTATVGWLRTTDLATVAHDAKPPGWLGNWSFGDSAIVVTRDAHGGLHVVGDTVNTGRASAPSGSFEGDLTVDGATGVFTDATMPSCTVSFRRVDRYLIASDGEGCTGVGATFLGVYSR